MAEFDPYDWRPLGWFCLKIGDRVLASAPEVGPIIDGTVTKLDPEPGNDITIGKVTIEGTDAKGKPLESWFWMSSLPITFWQPADEPRRPLNSDLPIPETVQRMWDEYGDE